MRYRNPYNDQAINLEILILRSLSHIKGSASHFIQHLLGQVHNSRILFESMLDLQNRSTIYFLEMWVQLALR